MCGLECSENEECRFDKENCEYKCLVLSIVKIGASIGAVIGALLIGLLIFFVVRHFRNKVQDKNTINVEKQLDYEVSYRYATDKNETENESVNIENEETYEPYQSAEYETYDEM